MQRREFLGTIAALTAAGTVQGSMASSEWHALRYAAATGDFVSAVGDDPVEQLRFAAAVGYRGYLDPGWLQRPADQQQALVETARETRIELGPCIGPCVPADWWRDADLSEWQRDVRVAVHRCRDAGLTGLRFPVGPASLEVEPAHFARRTMNVLEHLETCVDDDTFRLIIEPWQDSRPCRCGFSGWCIVVTPPIFITLDFTRRWQPDVIEKMIFAAGLAQVQHVELGDVCSPAATALVPAQVDRILEQLEQRGYAGLIGLRRTHHHDTTTFV